MPFDVEGARKAGYSDAEIAQHLARESNFDLSGAKNAGYSDGEVIAELSGKVGARAEIPGQDPNVKAPPAAAPAAPAGAPPASIVDRAIGAGEAALTVATGATGGTIGLAHETVSGMLDALFNGKFGTQEAANLVEQRAMRGAQALTYEPRTPAGQQQAAAVGSAMQNLVPVAAVAPGLVPAIARSRGAPVAVVARAGAEGAARAVAGEAGAAGVARAIDATTRLPQAVKSAYDSTAAKISRGFGMSDAMPTVEGGSVGAAGVERGARLAATAEGLPVPIRLTRGEKSGEAQQLRFEQEQAKGPLGAPIRERSAETNRRLGQNIEKLIEETGAETGSNIEAGRSVAGTLARAEARERVREKTLWRRADEQGALSDLVDLQPVADYLNQNRAGRTSAPIMEVIAREIEVQKLGSGSLADGTLTIGPVNLKQAEGLRKAVNKFVKENDGADLRVGSDIKRAIDAQTEGLGNALYQEARKSTQRREQLFGENAIVSQLIRNRKGTKDRQVALEDVFKETILKGSREDLGMLRRTLDVSDQRAGIRPGTTGEGAQAWRELQGATLRHMLDEAQKGFSVAQDGAQRFSGAQYAKVLRDLESGDKLRFIFGPQRAQLLRDVNEVARAVQAFPAGAVNSSNTASVILQAIGEAGVTGSLTGLPVPAISLIRAVRQQIKDRALRKRIEEALGEQVKKRAPNNKRNAPAVQEPPADATIH